MCQLKSKGTQLNLSCADPGLEGHHAITFGSKIIVNLMNFMQCMDNGHPISTSLVDPLILVPMDQSTHIQMNYISYEREILSY